MEILIHVGVLDLTYATTSLSFPLYFIIFHILLPLKRASDIRDSEIQGISVIGPRCLSYAKNAAHLG